MPMMTSGISQINELKQQQAMPIQMQKKRRKTGEIKIDNEMEDTNDQQQDDSQTALSSWSPPAEDTANEGRKGTPHELMTTYEGSNGSRGAMFDVVAKPSSSVLLQGLDIHVSDKIPDCPVTVYARSGSHVGYETKQLGWELLVDATVDCRGFMRRTKIPSDVFLREVRINPGETMSFYVYLPQVEMAQNNTLRYTNGDEMGAVFSEDDHLSIMEGSGLGGFFSEVYQPRIWNGMVRYTSEQQAQSQEHDECTELSMVSMSPADIGAYGNMFDLRTLSQSITVTGMDLHASTAMANSYVTYKVFTKRDTFRLHGQNGLDAWYAVAAGTVLASGEGEISVTVPTAAFVPIGVPAGTIQGFYVTFSTPNMSSKSTTQVANQVYNSNEDMELMVGVGVDTYPPNSNSYFGPTEWSGNIRYVRGNAVNNFQSGGLCNEVAPTAMPTTIQPTRLPTLYPTVSPTIAPSPWPTNQPTTSSPTPSPFIETTVSYVMYVQHSKTWPTDVVADSVAADVHDTITNIMGMNKAFKKLIEDYGLQLKDVTSSTGSVKKVGYSCQPTATAACTLIEATVHLSHSSSLESGRVSYEFLRLVDDVTESVGLGASLSASYVGDEPVSTKTILTLYNVPERIMGQQESAHFQDVVASFLNDALALMNEFDDAPDGAPQILSVEVYSQDIVTASSSSRTTPSSRTRMSQRAWGWMVSNFQNNRNNKNEGNRSLQSSSSIEIATTITGQYRPPPNINFPALVQDSIDTGSTKLTKDLTASTTTGNSEVVGGYFEEISGVTSEPVTPILPVEPAAPATTSPNPLPLSSEKTKRDGSGNESMVIASVVVTATLLAAALLYLIFLKRRRAMQSTGCVENDDNRDLVIKTKKRTSIAKTESIKSHSSRSLPVYNQGWMGAGNYVDDELGMPHPTFHQYDEEGHGVENGRREQFANSRHGIRGFGDLGMSNGSLRSLGSESRVIMKSNHSLPHHLGRMKDKVSDSEERGVRENIHRLKRSHSDTVRRPMANSGHLRNTGSSHRSLQRASSQRHAVPLVDDNATIASVIAPMGLVMNKTNEAPQNLPSRINFDLDERLTSTRSNDPAGGSSADDIYEVEKLSDVPLSKEKPHYTRGDRPSLSSSSIL